MNDFIITNYGLTLLALVIVLAAQFYVNFNYKKYSKKKNNRNLTGAEAARLILEKNGLSNVYVVETQGKLTDHYDPTRKVIRLSSSIYNDSSIASVAVAAHECGHALQDKNGYTLLRVRNTLIPIVNISSKLGYFAILFGLIFDVLNLIWIGIAFECIILIFQLLTLPIEFDASNRALKEIKKENLLESKEYAGGKKMLTSAALTYVASVASTLLEIFRLILVYGNRKDRR